MQLVQLKLWPNRDTAASATEPPPPAAKRPADVKRRRGVIDVYALLRNALRHCAGTGRKDMASLQERVNAYLSRYVQM